MTDDLSWEEKGTTLVLLKSAYDIAQCIAENERDRDKTEVAQRMFTALRANLAEMELLVFGATIDFQQPTLESLCVNLSEDDKFALLIELRLTNPFFPFEFEMKGKRDEWRFEQMRQIASRELHMERVAANQVDDAVRTATKGLHHGGVFSSMGTKDWSLIIGGGALLAAAAVVAAPLVAVAIAPAGLSGAAAMSAGLAALGGGSLASGGLGMAGGMWVLGLSGAALGSAAGATASALSRGEGVEVIKAEVLKLCASFELSRKSLISRAMSEFEEALQAWHDEVLGVLSLEEARNEEGSTRLKDLRELDSLMRRAGQFMVEQQKRDAD